MKLGKRPLLGGIVAAAALMLIGTSVPQVVYAQQQKGKKGTPASNSDPRFLALFRDAVAPAAKSTVRVKCDGKDTALGVVLTADGFILTKASDLIGKITVKIGDSEEKEAKWIGHHQPHDLAVLKIEAKGLTPIKWEDSKVAPVGNFVASVGIGPEPVAVGVISVAARDVPPPKETKAAAKGEGKGDAKAPSIASTLFTTIDDPKGAKVTAIPSGKGGGGKGGDGGGKKGGGGKGGDGGGQQTQPSPAAGKVKVDDIIIAVGAKAITGTESLTKEIQNYKAGQELTLRIIRGEEFIELKLTLNKQQQPANRADQQNNMGSELSKRRTGFPTIVQHDTVVRPTDCGGPLVDLEGHVIGINIARYGRVESYAVPSEAIKPLLKDLMSGTMAPKK